MKTLFTILTMLSLASTGCQPSLDQKVQDLHNQNHQTIERFRPGVEQLIFLRNSINVQGRALTLEEVEFTGQVNQIEIRYSEYKRELEDLMEGPVDSARLQQERLLLQSLQQMQVTLDSLEQVRL